MGEEKNLYCAWDYETGTYFEKNKYVAYVGTEEDFLNVVDGCESLELRELTLKQIALLKREYLKLANVYTEQEIEY